jgi:hypothetical protein
MAREKKDLPPIQTEEIENSSSNGSRDFMKEVL